MSLSVAAPLPADPFAASPRLSGPVRLGILLLLLFGVGLGGWSALVPLSTGVSAPGELVVDGRRKTVQHLEGGIVSDLPVAEGDRVEAGDVLLRLDPIQSESQVGALEAQLANALARQARLQAEVTGADRLPSDPTAGIVGGTVTADLLETAWAREVSVLEQRRRFLAGQAAMTEQQVASLHGQIDGLAATIATERRQAALIEEEASALRSLVDRGLAERPRLLALERQQAAIDGRISELTTAIGQAEQSMVAARLTLADTEARMMAETVEQAAALDSEIAALRERLAAAHDVLRRVAVTAPVAGTVYDLTVANAGAVVAPGAALMEIVPAEEGLVIQARLRPVDVDSVAIGQTARVRLTGLDRNAVPELQGEVIGLSADALVSDTDGSRYFDARIRLTDLSPLPADIRLGPGMPADVLVVTGEKTVARYLIDPLAATLGRAMRTE